jgi:hypothetical protein
MPANASGLKNPGRWEPERPEAKSLWLLPSGPDQIGDGLARPTPAAHMGAAKDGRKLIHRWSISSFAVHGLDPTE